ncbi:MAG: hypothetical protein ACE363_01725 [Alphaproteobacteria bacterium]
MITFVTTHAARGTHKPVKRFPGSPPLRQRSYWKLFHSRSVHSGTYILTDFDRLGPWELELATHLYKHLKTSGARVLNNPGMFRARYAFLQHLHREGLNSFRAWNPVLGEFPDRFPVFLRTQAAHRGTKTGLLDNASLAQEALDEAVSDGHPLSDLMFVEYRAAPEENGTFLKLSAYRLGDRIVPAIVTMSMSWLAKLGDRAAGSQQQYEEDYERIQSYPYTDAIMAIFEAAKLDYGRIDFGIVDGRIETYEINTNPWMGMPNVHPVPLRITATEKVRQLYASALTDLDTEGPEKRIALDHPVLREQRAHDRRRLYLTRWTP